MNQSYAIRCIKTRRYSEVAGHFLKVKLGNEIVNLDTIEREERSNKLGITIKNLHQDNINKNCKILSSQEIAEKTYFDVLELLDIQPNI